jgi:hypothetical protein
MTKKKQKKKRKKKCKKPKPKKTKTSMRARQSDFSKNSYIYGSPLFVIPCPTAERRHSACNGSDLPSKTSSDFFKLIFRFVFFFCCELCQSRPMSVQLAFKLGSTGTVLEMIVPIEHLVHDTRLALGSHPQAAALTASRLWLVPQRGAARPLQDNAPWAEVLARWEAGDALELREAPYTGRTAADHVARVTGMRRWLGGYCARIWARGVVVVWLGARG